MEVTIISAFIAGIVSFLAPCVLPIIPGFLAYLAGSSVKDSATHRRDIFLNSVFFVLGFSLVCAAFGVLLNAVLDGYAVGAVQDWLSRIGGAIVILFGLYLVGLLPLPFLEREYKFTVKIKFKSKYATSFLFGAAFAAGWTPCVGAILGGILGLAISMPGSAFFLLLSYALGLGIPFLLVGLFAAQADHVIKRYAKVALVVNRIFGVILIILGIFIFTQQLARIASFKFLNRILLGE
jgi:cytochrome c-type biogenesis protein